MNSNENDNKAELVYDEWLSFFLQKPAFRLEKNVCAFSSHQFPKTDAFVGAKVSVEDVKDAWKAIRLYV